MSRHHRIRSTGNQSDDGSVHNNNNNNNNNNDNESSSSTFEQPILVYHESARSIVFRDQLRRAVQKLSIVNDVVSSPSGNNLPAVTKEMSSPNSIANVVPVSPTMVEATESTNPPTPTTIIAGFQPKIVPLPALELNPSDEYTELLDSQYNKEDIDIHDDFTDAEKEVCNMLLHQRCTVKTIKNEDWSAFLQRFLQPKLKHRNQHSYQYCAPKEHDDIPPDKIDNEGIQHYPFNSFVTSTSLLPTDGKRMRCYGSIQQYTVGVVFALPSYDHLLPDYDKINKQEDIDTKRTQTWSWPSGYSAKTGFNIDSRGQLINGWQEALHSLSTLRQYIYHYAYQDEQRSLSP